jgi:hypothetical protein
MIQETDIGIVRRETIITFRKSARKQVEMVWEKKRKKKKRRKKKWKRNQDSNPSSLW